ncbi:MAG TPA: cysteine peptidase family C39 domain-containing protein [Polyangia bacterium]|nr:cysteine peptidase family C39 domain-containing protein [Polyangia bacterium]
MAARALPAVALLASISGDLANAQAGGGAPHLLPVPLISQSSSWTCGSAALMAALVYFGVFDDPQSRLDAELAATPRDGTRVRNIVAVARRFGLRAAARTELSLDDLAGELRDGAVVIVALQAWAGKQVTDWRSDWEDGHYVVVVGVTGDRVYVMDPSVRTGYAYLARDQFLERWHDYDQDGDRKKIWNRLGIVLQGGAGLRRYPAEPTPVE